MEYIRTHLGSQLKRARQQADLKQEHVASYLKVSVSAISALEKGLRKLEASELYYLSKLYGKPLDWFFGSEDTSETNQAARWYDQDPLIAEALQRLQQASPELQRKAAYGILGFLSDR